MLPLNDLLIALRLFHLIGSIGTRMDYCSLFYNEYIAYHLFNSQRFFFTEAITWSQVKWPLTITSILQSGIHSGLYKVELCYQTRSYGSWKLE